MSALPRITLVTPTLNQGSFLEDTILSVLDQKYANLEYLVLDGGSTDNSLEIIKKYQSFLKHWRSHPDDGQAAALREGFEMSSGDILGWLNSDDLLTPGSLHTVAQTYLEHGPDILVAGGCRVFGAERAPVVHWPSFQNQFNCAESMPVRRMLDLMMHWFPGEFFYQPEVFFPSSAYRRSGGIDPTIFYTMDYDLWMRFALDGLHVVVVSEVLAEYREHPQQKTADLRALHRQMADIAGNYLKDDRNGISRLERRFLAICNRLALNSGSQKALATARRIFDV